MSVQRRRSARCWRVSAGSAVAAISGRSRPIAKVARSGIANAASETAVNREFARTLDGSSCRKKRRSRRPLVGASLYTSAWAVATRSFRRSVAASSAKSRRATARSLLALRYSRPSSSTSLGARRSTRPFASEIRFPSRAQRARRSSTNRSTVITAGTYHSVALTYDGRRRSTRSRDSRSHRPALRPRGGGEPWLCRGPGFRGRVAHRVRGTDAPLVRRVRNRRRALHPWRRRGHRHPRAHLVLLHPPRVAVEWADHRQARIQAAGHQRGRLASTVHRRPDP